MPERPRVLLLVQEGRDLYRSRHWPAGLDARLPTRFPAGCAGAANAAGTPRHLWLAVNWTLPRATMHATAKHFYLATLPMFLLVGITAWLLAGRVMRPVDHLTAAMVAVNANAQFEHVRPADEALEFAQRSMYSMTWGTGCSAASPTRSAFRATRRTNSRRR